MRTHRYSLSVDSIFAGRDRAQNRLMRATMLDTAHLSNSSEALIHSSPSSAASSRLTVLTNSRISIIPAQELSQKKRYQYDPQMTTQRELNLLLVAEQVAPSVASAEEKKLAAPQQDHVDACSRLSIQADFDSGDEVISKKPRCLRRQVLASVTVSIGSMIVGFASGYTSPALVSMESPNSTITVSSQEASWIGGLMPLAALIGGVVGGPLIEVIGRKTTIMATALPFMVSWLLIAFAVNVPMILVGRCIAGFCVGIASLCLPVYMGETVQAEVRGMLGLISTTFGNLGILTVFTAGMYLDWSQLAFVGAAIPVPFLLSMFLIPETPRWYISKNKTKEARDALQWLRGKDADITAELREIEKTHNDAEKNAPSSAFDLLNKTNIKPLLISIGLMFFQQLSGINAVIFYTVQIFMDAGSTIDKNICTIIVGVVNLGATFIATALIDRLGRKVLLYISATFMSLTLMTLGTFFYMRKLGYDVSDYGWLPLVSFVVFVVAFSLGFGPIPWLMMGEILPAKIRGPAASVATGFNWSCTFIVTKTFNDLIGAVGTYGAFWIFGTICVISVFFIYFCVPETQGKSLEDIEKRFKGPVRRMSSIANLKPLPMAV